MSKIVIVCSYPLPTGMAATTRIMSYSKGLVANGVAVEVLSYIPSGNIYLDSSDNSGSIDGVYYCYPLRKKRFKNRFLHIIESILSILVTYRKIIRDGKANNYDALIISNDNPFILLLFSIAAKRINTVSLFIFDEFPIPIRRFLKTKIPAWKKSMYKIALKRIDGYISMTNKLVEFYTNIASKPSLIISSITDIERFSTESVSTPEITESEIRITYMGNMELSKDNVDNIIRAFSIISEKHTTANLYLYGAPSQDTKTSLVSLITELNLTHRVNFGFANFYQVPEILKKSHILVSSQPNTKRAEGGFPTKVGEYLAVGNPILITNVGEISHHVENNTNIFLAEPENPNDFADKLNYIIENYKEAQLVAKAGKKLVAEKYSNFAAASSMKEFITKLKFDKND